jgi:hypothetical protein
MVQEVLGKSAKMNNVYRPIAKADVFVAIQALRLIRGFQPVDEE